MGTIRLFKVWFMICLMVLSGASLSYAQFSDCGVNTCTNDNVGIGTTSPEVKLDVAGEQIRVITGGAGVQMILESSGTGGRRYSIESTSGAHFAGQGKLTFRDETAGGLPRMVIDDAGNLGIGTTSPTSKLHVAGDATIDGNIAAKYQDIAEWVRAPALLSPGTVVVIDPLESNRVLPAYQPYDTRIAGVVSPQPGILLGEAGEDKAKVAHSGRVKVKVDAQFGPILVGDLLVSSSTTGYAMRSTPIEMNGISIHRPGTIVGKALEPLKEGEGEILVLLTLQ